MKYFFSLLLMISVGTQARSQSSKYLCDSYLKGVPIVNGKVEYTEVIECSGSKDTLFYRAKSFLSTLFPNFSNVVKVDDRDLGKVSVRGIFSNHISGKGIMAQYIEYWGIFTIEVKDGKYKYELLCDDLVHAPVKWYTVINMLKKKSKISNQSAEKFHENNERSIRVMRAYMSGYSEVW